MGGFHHGFNAARGFVGGAARLCLYGGRLQDVSMPHAALWVVQPTSGFHLKIVHGCFNAARGFVGGAAPSLSALVPLRGKRPFGKSPEI